MGEALKVCLFKIRISNLIKAFMFNWNRITSDITFYTYSYKYTYLKAAQQLLSLEHPTPNMSLMQCIEYCDISPLDISGYGKREVKRLFYKFDMKIQSFW